MEQRPFFAIDHFEKKKRLISRKVEFEVLILKKSKAFLHEYWGKSRLNRPNEEVLIERFISDQA